MRRLKMTLTALGAVVAAASGLSGASAGGLLPTAIYSDDPFLANALVPGLEDERFDTRTWDSLRGSPSGEWWTLTCSVGVTESRNETLLRGHGTDGSAGRIIARERDSADALRSGRSFEFLEPSAEVNDAGVVVFAGDFNGTADDDYIATWDGENYFLHAQQGTTAFPYFPFLVNWVILDTPNILENDEVGFAARNMIGNPGGANESEAYMLGTNVRIFEGATIPANQVGGAMRAWEVIDSNGVDFNGDGSRSIVKGDLKGGSTTDDDVVVVDGAVVIQEGQIIPGFASPVDDAAVTLVRMTGSGDWFVDGGNDDGADWIMRNGEVIARTGDAITPGNALAWDDAAFAGGFFLSIGNNVGDFVIGGYTDAADQFADACLVYNGKRVLLREGDPVDLDGNGLADDGVFIRAWHENDAFLTDDGILSFLCSLRASNTDHVQVGQALVYVDINGGANCPSDLATETGPGTDGVTNLFDLLGLLSQWGGPGSADISNSAGTGADGVVNLFDLLALLASWGPCE